MNKDDCSVSINVLVSEAAGIIRAARGMFVGLYGSCPEEVERHLQALAAGYLQLFKNIIPGWGALEVSSFIINVSPPGTSVECPATSPHLASLREPPVLDS